MKGCKFWSMLGTHGLEQWGFFSVPHLLWYGTSVYNCRHRGPVTLTPIAERLAAELLLPVFTTSSVRLGFEHPTFRMRGERFDPWSLRHCREVCLRKQWDTYGMRCLGFFWFFLTEFTPYRQYFSNVNSDEMRCLVMSDLWIFIELISIYSCV